MPVLPARHSPGTDGPTVIRTGTNGSVQYKGHDNRYHNFKAFWTTGTATKVEMTAAGLKSLNGGEDTEQEILPADSSPWKDTEGLTRLLARDSRKPWEAFKLNGDMRELRSGHAR